MHVRDPSSQIVASRIVYVIGYFRIRVEFGDIPQPIDCVPGLWIPVGSRCDCASCYAEATTTRSGRRKVSPESLRVRAAAVTCLA